MRPVRAVQASEFGIDTELVRAGDAPRLGGALEFRVNGEIESMLKYDQGNSTPAQDLRT